MRKSNLALYRKYRSKSLNEVIGQKHITDILSRAITEGHISHAYLLTGPRGVGKTSVARILAHEINGLDYDENKTNLDIIEIDAASNNGVEDVRDLREKVQIAPFSADKKIYIIDEVHMLSKAAFNALLKTLEEPPNHIVFILATTNAEKLPATIISRVQRFNFRPISIDDAVNHLSNIAIKENINIDDDALKLIALRSDGSFRDSISLLDQLSNIINTDDNIITVKLIENLLGLAPSEIIDQIIETVEKHNITKLVELLNQSFNEGIDCNSIVNQLTNSIRQQIITKPQLLPLLDTLIDVTKSPQPQLKLLSVLGMATIPKQSHKSIAQSTSTHKYSKTIAELEQQAVAEQNIDYRLSIKEGENTKKVAKQQKTKNTNPNHLDYKLIENLKSSKSELAPGPNSNLNQIPDITPENNSTKNNTLSSRSVIDLRDTLEPKSELAPGPNSDLARSSVTKNNNRKGDNIKNNPELFDWAKLIDYTRQHHIALYSVLSKCGHSLNDSKLTIYTNSKFYKNKLDDSKYSLLLHKCLHEIGIHGLDVHTIPTSLPPANSQVAAIAVIMGGGQEIILDS